MKILENISEYYDELFPVSLAQREFYENLATLFKNPVKYLRLCCGTGEFEQKLSQEGADVTGIETITDLLESANRRRRTQLMALRFFNMKNDELSRFLGKGFYNIISILDGRILFVGNESEIKKLIFDCKTLLSDFGRLVISVPDFEFFDKNPNFVFSRESIRVKFFERIKKNSDGSFFLEQKIETGNGDVRVVTDCPVCALSRECFFECAKDAGFSSVEFKNGFDDKSQNTLLAVLS